MDETSGIFPKPAGTIRAFQSCLICCTFFDNFTTILDIIMNLANFGQKDGEILALPKTYGPWKVEGTVGEGGQAHVYLVKDTRREGGKLFALKRLKNEQRKARFAQEVEAIRQLQHPNILRVEDYDISGDRPYYVAEYCQRGSLSTVGAQEFKGNIEKTLGVLLPVAEAVARVHAQGIFHRDIKPVKILLPNDGTPVRFRNLSHCGGPDLCDSDRRILRW